MLWPPTASFLLADQNSTVTDCDVACVIIIRFSMILNVGNSRHFESSSRGCYEQTNEGR